MEASFSWFWEVDTLDLIYVSSSKGSKKPKEVEIKKDLCSLSLYFPNLTDKSSFFPYGISE
jgi:hypothetical protein